MELWAAKSLTAIGSSSEGGGLGDGQETVNHILRNPGENIELDYAGMKLSLKSAHLIEDDIEVTIFIATLSYSSYFYAEGLTRCDEKNWIDPSVNETFQNWADYYGTAILPGLSESQDGNRL